MGFEANYLSTDSQQTTLIKEAFENGTKVGWKITIAGTSSKNIWYGDGIVSAYSMGDLTQDGKVSLTFELKTKGKPTGPSDST